MQELEEGRGWIGDAKDNKSGILLKDLYASCFEEILQREAVRLGVQFQVGGKWCSFVAVSENEHMSMEPSEGVECEESDGCEGVAEREADEESDEDIGFGLFDSFSPSKSRPATPPPQRRGTTTRSTGSLAQTTFFCSFSADPPPQVYCSGGPRTFRGGWFQACCFRQ